MTNEAPYGLTIYSTNIDQGTDVNGLISLASLVSLSDIRLITIGAYKIFPSSELEGESYVAGGGVLVDNTSARKTFDVISQNFKFPNLDTMDALFSVLDQNNKYFTAFDYPRTLCSTINAIQVSISEYTKVEAPPLYRVQIPAKRVK